MQTAYNISVINLTGGDILEDLETGMRIIIIL
jgi:hypothetical protein